jgi:hypothetical protein
MTDLRAELEQFEARYKMEVGRLYADLDEIEARSPKKNTNLFRMMRRSKRRPKS